MADDHSFYSAETAMLCARCANEVDWVGMPNDVCFDVFVTPFGNFCSRLCIPAGFRRNTETELGFRHFEKPERVPSLTRISTYLCTK